MVFFYTTLYDCILFYGPIVPEINKLLLLLLQREQHNAVFTITVSLITDNENNIMPCSQSPSH